MIEHHMARIPSISPLWRKQFGTSSQRLHSLAARTLTQKTTPTLPHLHIASPSSPAAEQASASSSQRTAANISAISTVQYTAGTSGSTQTWGAHLTPSWYTVTSLPTRLVSSHKTERLVTAALCHSDKTLCVHLYRNVVIFRVINVCSIGK